MKQNRLRKIKIRQGQAQDVFLLVFIGSFCMKEALYTLMWKCKESRKVVKLFSGFFVLNRLDVIPPRYNSNSDTEKLLTSHPALQNRTSQVWDIAKHEFYYLALNFVNFLADLGRYVLLQHNFTFSCRLKLLVNLA